MKMTLYECTVRLSAEGEVTNEVFKDSVTAPEVLIFREIHGGVRGVKMAPGQFDTTHMAERTRLEELYGPKVVENVFGPRALATRLPIKLDDLAGMDEESIEEDEAA